MVLHCTSLPSSYSRAVHVCMRICQQLAGCAVPEAEKLWGKQAEGTLKPTSRPVTSLRQIARLGESWCRSSGGQRWQQMLQLVVAPYGMHAREPKPALTCLGCYLFRLRLGQAVSGGKCQPLMHNS